MTSMPFWNLIPRTTFGNWFSLFNRRHVFAAALTSLNEFGGLRRENSLRPHGSMTHRCKQASIGFDARRWSQCSAGKSKKFGALNQEQRVMVAVIAALHR